MFGFRGSSGLRRAWQGGIGCFFSLFVVFASAVMAEAADVLRSAGIGGATVALFGPEGGFQLNPAALVHARSNHLALHLSTSGWDYERLDEGVEARYRGAAQGRVRPSLYYSHGFGDLGISVGYLADLNNQLDFSLLNTRSTYFVNEQRFESETQLKLIYESFWERGWYLGIGWRSSIADLGVRVKWLTQTAKQGVLTPSLRLEAQLEDVNPNKADEVIPAIVDGLELDQDALRHPEDDVMRDVTADAWDVDVGMQTTWLATRLQIPHLTAGLLLQNVLQRQRVTPAPLRLGIGVSWLPLPWLHTVAEFAKGMGEAGPELHLGWEANHGWRAGMGGEVSLRNGWSREQGAWWGSLGVGLRLGTAIWEYAWQTPLTSARRAHPYHLVASTIQF